MHPPTRLLRLIVGSARHSDLPGLVELQVAAEEAERAFSPDLGARHPDRRHARRCFKRTLCNPDRRTFIARAGRRPIAMMGIDLHRSRYRHDVVRRYAYLHSLFVQPAFRGTGIARRLVRQGLAWARRSGAQQARLEMAIANRPARSLYESLGFRPREEMFTLDLRVGA